MSGTKHSRTHGGNKVDISTDVSSVRRKGTDVEPLSQLASRVLADYLVQCLEGDLTKDDDETIPVGKRAKPSGTTSTFSTGMDNETERSTPKACRIDQQLWDRAMVEFKTAGMPNYYCSNCKEFYGRKVDIQCDIEGCNTDTNCPSCLKKCWVCGLGYCIHHAFLHYTLCKKKMIFRCGLRRENDSKDYEDYYTCVPGHCGKEIGEVKRRYVCYKSYGMPPPFFSKINIISCKGCADICQECGASQCKICIEEKKNEMHYMYR